MKSRDFVGTRGRCQRIPDFKVFNGFIERFSENRVSLTTSADHPVTVGELFKFEGFGNKISVAFLARLEGVTARTEPIGPQPGADGSFAPRVVEVRETTLQLVVASPMMYANSPEAVRYKVKKIYAPITHDGRVIEAYALDAGIAGLGLRCDEAIDPETEVTIAMHTPNGLVTATALCRHCRQDEAYPGKFRAGFMFLKLGRIDKPKWDRYLDEAA